MPTLLPCSPSDSLPSPSVSTLELPLYALSVAYNDWTSLLSLHAPFHFSYLSTSFALPVRLPSSLSPISGHVNFFTTWYSPSLRSIFPSLFNFRSPHRLHLFQVNTHMDLSKSNGSYTIQEVKSRYSKLRNTVKIWQLLQRVGARLRFLESYKIELLIKWQKQQVCTVTKSSFRLYDTNVGTIVIHHHIFDSVLHHNLNSCDRRLLSLHCPCMNFLLFPRGPIPI